MKIVKIYGTAVNLSNAPLVVPDSNTEVWISNNYRPHYGRLARLRETDEWTHWCNLHGKEHMLKTYPKCYEWYQKQTKPIYLRDVDPDIPSSRKFPREAIQNCFGGPQMGSPGRYFTFSGSWLTAKAIMDGAERIEFWGFRLADKPAKPHMCYKFERPCFFYWVKQARDKGIEVTYQPEVEAIPFEPGDPATYTGSLYGYETTEPFA